MQSLAKMLRAACFYLRMWIRGGGGIALGKMSGNAACLQGFYPPEVLA